MSKARNVNGGSVSVASPDAGEAARAAATAERRRGNERREPDLTRSIDTPPPSQSAEALIPERWTYLLGTVLLSILGCFAVSAHWPGNGAFAVLSVCVLGLLAGPKAHRWARGKDRKSWIAAALATVIVPLSVFGLGISRWAASGAMRWDTALMALTAVSVVAASYHRKRPGMIFAVVLPMWGWAAFVSGSTVGLAGLAILSVLAVRVSVEQTRSDKDALLLDEARERSHLRVRGILHDYEETGKGWFWEIDRRGQITYLSAPIAYLLGQKPDLMVGRPLKVLFHPDGQQEESETSLAFHLKAQTRFSEVPIRAAVQGEERWWSVSGRPVFGKDGEYTGFRGSGTDLTESRKYREEATKLATFDPLTGLYNRRQLGRLLEEILSNPQEQDRTCSLLLLDLDRFKQVNDTMGHPAGDELLRQVAARLEEAVASLGVVGRRGGDEFEVLLPGPIGRETLTPLAHGIIDSLSRPYCIESRPVRIGASIGIACAPEHGIGADDLARNADLALYAAKDAGRGRFQYYDDSLHSAAQERAQMERDLREAIGRGGLELRYQPVVHTGSERICGFEALLRWNHPERGWIAPELFVERAEDAGLIQQMGDWVLRTACENAADWPDDVRVAVNVSPLQMANPQLPATVTSALAATGIDPSRLELEVTESVFLQESESVDMVLAALKAIGVRLVLDDFGTGYSSLAYVERAAFDKIKIDRSFVRGATDEGSRKGAIIASITGLAQALGMDSVAEGVETLDELDLVRLHGCSQVQGFIYERPLDAQAVLQRLETGLQAVAIRPGSVRQERHSAAQQITLRRDGRDYQATIRDISRGGAMIEGLWNVPEGTAFTLITPEGDRAPATVRWSTDNRMGVEIGPLERDANASKSLAAA